ncbi:MAG: lipopolysaccharide biosynthesis protein [Pyrinomonadaceae bacterium]
MTATERKQSSLINQSAWILLAKVTGFALNMVLPLLVVRYLTQDNVGVYRQSFLVASNAVLVLPLGFSMSAYYFLNRDPDRHPLVVMNILIFNCLMGAAAFVALFLFPEILGSTFNSAELARLSPLIGLVVWVWIFAGFLETAAISLQEARLAAGFIVFTQLLKTVLMTAAVVYFQSVDSLLYAVLVLFSLQAVLMVWYLNRRFPRFWARVDLPFFRKQMAYAIPFGLSVMLYVLQTDIHNYFVSHSFSAAEFAIYSVGCFQLPLVAMLWESVGAVMIPKMSQLQDQGRTREMLELTVKATQKLTFFYFPLFGFLMIVADEFITTLFTRDYQASAAIFRVNLLTLPLFSFVVDPITRAFPSAGRFLLKVRVGIFIAVFAVFWAGLGRFGLVEMIGIVVGSVLVERIAASWISARMLEGRFEDLKLFWTTAKIALAAVAAAAILFAVYLAAAEVLMTAALSVSQKTLGLFGTAKGVEFVGGSIFLSICFAVYAAVYLLIANSLGAIEADDKDRAIGYLRRLNPWRRAQAGAI